MRVLRSSLFVAVTAFIAAACGDKVNVVQPANTATITSVQVAPATATISVGQTVTLTAAVNASAGVTPTVTWSTSSSAAATVSQAGLVTGMSASPGVAICASAAASGVASVTSCATVVVQAASIVTPAVLQIASITNAGNLNSPVTVAPGFTGGQINVSVNVYPGTAKMDSVVVTLNGVSAASASFTSAQAAALRSAANGATADQALQQTLVFSINTAAFYTATGLVIYPNGAYTVGVVGYSHQGTTPATNSSTQNVQLNFANADGWITSLTLGAGTNNATSASGFNYVGGPTASVSMTAIPVLFTPGSVIASATGSFGSGCDASGFGIRTVVLTAPVAPSRTWTGTFTRAQYAAAAAGNVNNYEFSAGLCSGANLAGGDNVGVAASLYSTNTQGPTFIYTASPNIRLDNRAPGAPQFTQNPNGRQNGWINASVALTGVNKNVAPFTSNGWVLKGAADAGEGGYNIYLRTGAPGAGNISDPVSALTPSKTPALPAPSLTGATYCAVVSAQDDLGNESNLPANGTVCAAAVTPPYAGVALAVGAPMLFGVDIAPPTIAFNGGLAASKAGTGNTGANVGAEFTVAVSDTGVVGNSGMLAGAPVFGTVMIRTAAAGLTAAQLCPVGTVVSGVCTASSTGFAAAVYPNVSTNTIAAQTVIGYYTYTAQSSDAAGNVSTTVVSRVASYNPVANIPALTPSLYSTPLNSPTAVFTATGSSGNTTVNGPTTFFDLWKATYILSYSLGGLNFNYAPTTLQTFNAVPFVNNAAPVAITINNFVRGIEYVSSACNAPLATTGAIYKPAALTENLFDMVGNQSGNVVTAIPGASVTNGVSYLTTPTYAFIESNGVSENPAAGGCQLGAGANTVVAVGIGGTSPDPTSVTLNADVFGPTATYQPPFTSVNFYVYVGGTNMELIGSAPYTNTYDDGSANGRRHRYSFTWTPGAKSPVSATAYTGVSSAACTAPSGANLSIWAIGVSAAGDGLLGIQNLNICPTNAP